MRIKNIFSGNIISEQLNPRMGRIKTNITESIFNGKLIFNKMSRMIKIMSLLWKTCLI